MRVQTDEWQRFIPGVRIYKGKMTLFYNGEKLWEGGRNFGRCLVYNIEERNTWQVMIVLPGVEVIPRDTFYNCRNIKTVIMADKVKRIESNVFFGCDSLEEIGSAAFKCAPLLILGLPQNVELGSKFIQNTPLVKKAPLSCEVDRHGNYSSNVTVAQWVKSINNEDVYALHRACASFDTLPEIIHALVKRHGIKTMRMPNTIGITPSQYLAANTFAEISEKDIINRYISVSMGEVF